MHIFSFHVVADNRENFKFLTDIFAIPKIQFWADLNENFPTQFT